MDVGFLNRLKCLQRLCDPTRDKDAPCALLFISGPDGKSNKGSISGLKYLFFGAVGKDLYDESNLEAIESLDEMVLLIQHTSVSVMWRSATRKKLHHLLSMTPLLIEYCTTKEEEQGDEDQLQLKKCRDFKKMLVEAVPLGENLGIPIPIGYTDVYDIEHWPLLQAFAMDEVLPGVSAGFLTSRNSVIDITEKMDNLFQCVDNYVVNHAIYTMVHTVLPHARQFLDQMGVSLCGVLSGAWDVAPGAINSTAPRNAEVTAEDLLGPFELLFQFGSMHTNFSVNPILRPIILFGVDTSHIGRPSDAFDWTQHTASHGSLHCVVEACEPSTGIRWCRSYLLHRGRSTHRIHIDSLVSNGDEEEEQEGDEKQAEDDVIRSSTGSSTSISAVTEQGLRRLEALYCKLQLALRYAVRCAFTVSSSVLEAASFIQSSLDGIMKRKECFQVMGFRAASNTDGAVLDKVSLRKGEVMQLHMDCMNAHGQIITVEDIKDIHDVCWVYIRVAIHGIALKTVSSTATGSQPATVPLGSIAVGDTFLFSACSRAQRKLDVPSFGSVLASTGDVSAPFSPYLHYGDPFCITHAIPYYRCLYGSGVEANSINHFMACLRLPRIRLALGLGNKITDESLHTNRYNTASSNLPIKQLSVPMLTDHPLYQHATANTTFYESGFVIDKLDELHCHPLCITFALHVDRVWIVDVREVMSACIRLYVKSFRSAGAGSPKEALLDTLAHLSKLDIDGLLIVFRLRDMNGCKQARQSLSKGGASASGGGEEGYSPLEQDYLELISVLQSNFSDDADNHDFREAYLHNPLASNLPFTATGSGVDGFGKYIGLFFTSITASDSSYTLSPNSAFSSNSNSSTNNSSSTTILTSVLSVWKKSIKALSIPYYIGSNDVSLPDEILSSFAASLDLWKFVSMTPETLDLLTPSKFSDAESSSSLYSAREEMDAYIRTGLHATDSVQIPALGYEQMSAHHLVSESFFLGTSRDNRTSTEVKPASLSGNVVLISSIGGVGVYNLAKQMRERMLSHAKQEGISGVNVEILYLDLNQTVCKIAQRSGADSLSIEVLVSELSAQLLAASQYAFNKSSVVLACVTNSIAPHISTQSVMQLLSLINTCSICMSIAVVSDASLPAQPAETDPTAAGSPPPTATVAPVIGEELYQGEMFEMCSPLNCNCVIAITATSGSSTAYSALRLWLEANNPEAPLIKLTGTNLWIHDDYMYQIMASVPCLRTSKSGGDSSSSSATATLSTPWNSSAQILHGITSVSVYEPSEALFSRVLYQSVRMHSTLPNGIKSIHVVPFGAQEAIWDMVSLVNVLKAMFPGAAVSNTVVSEVWNAQCLQNDTKAQKMPYFAKARLLATIKIMCRKQVQLTRDATKESMSKNDTAVKALRCGHVHGIVRIKAGGWDLNGDPSSPHSSSSNHSTFAIVEANHSTIIIRPQLTDLVNMLEQESANAGASTLFCNQYSNSLYTTGCFAGDASAGDAAMVRELYTACLLQPLPVAPLLSDQDAANIVSSMQNYNPYMPRNKNYELLLNVQAKYGPSVPIPTGCWYDGEFYMDFHGNRTNIRPDIAKLVDIYVENNNRNAQKYNEIVELVSAFM